MQEFITQWAEFNNKPEHEKLSVRFIEYLKSHNHSGDILDKAEKTDWKAIIELFDIEFENLYSKFQLPNAMPELEPFKEQLRKDILITIQYNLYNVLYDILKENDEVLSSLNSYMGILFRPFDLQYTLTSLNKNNDPKVILKNAELLRKKADIGGKFMGKKSLSNEVAVFNKILERYNQELDDKREPSFREIAHYMARKELGLDQESEQQNFYKRFMAYKNK